MSVPQEWVPIRELAYWKNLLTTRTNTLRARAEKAERERDALRRDVELLRRNIADLEADNRGLYNRCLNAEAVSRDVSA